MSSSEASCDEVCSPCFDISALYFSPISSLLAFISSHCFLNSSISLILLLSFKIFVKSVPMLPVIP
ncbi:hypothetical protein E3F12_02485 [Campylobacter coli]|nr:hypothetical protein [Campylobacter coli]EAJ4627326.1 hypothetical protein [Campylobacter coli]EAJ7431997.1 hypothetical protein [Campylobacter coli]EAJ7513416.1 hypothetical protein [Campylobacter coli]